MPWSQGLEKKKKKYVDQVLAQSELLELTPDQAGKLLDLTKSGQTEESLLD